MSITLSHDGLPEGVSRDDLEQLAVDVGREVFRFSEMTIQLLLHYLDKVSESDFLKGRICGMWEQPFTTANKFKISTRALSYKECELEEAGLILRTGTPHAARTGKRTAYGIIFLAGINLAPIIDRFDELQDMLAVERQNEERAPLLRQQVSEKRAVIRASGNADLIALADAVSCGGRTKRITNIDRLEAILAELEPIMVQAALLSGAKITSDRCEADFAPNKPCESTSKHHTRSVSADGLGNDVGSITPAAAIRLASADFRATLDWIGERSWPNLIEASRRTCRDLGISQWVWGQACTKLGRQQAALCVLAIDRNHKLPPDHPFYCRQPSGALFMMSRKGSEQLSLNWLFRAMQSFPEDVGGNVVPMPLQSQPDDPNDPPPVGAHISKILSNLKLPISDRGQR